MTQNATLNGQVFPLPDVGNRQWGSQVTAYLLAISTATLQKSGGNFTLTADANFGANYGLVAAYFKSRGTNPATSGVLRLANTENISWRNVANNADMQLSVDSTDRLQFGGVNVPTISSTDTLTNKTLTNPVITTPTGLVKSDVGLGNADNTSDANKPVSTAQQAALDLKANLASPTFTGTVSGITKSMVGLGNVDNTSDATKNSAAAVLTNKDIDGGTASNTNRITVPKAASSTLSGLTRKQGTLLYDTTLGKLLLDDGTNLNAVGSGSGAGGVTLIANPSDAGSWSETGTVFATPATTTTSGDLPLGGATSSAIQFVATGNGAEASHYNSYSVTTSAAMNGKLQVDFFMRPGTGFAASEWTVSVYQGSTRQALSSDSSGVTYLPNNTGRFTVSFDAVASTSYTLRFARVSGSGSATLNVCNVFLGWPFVSQTAAVGKTQSVIVTGSWSTNTTYTALETQLGQWAYYQVKVALTGAPTSANLTINLPSGRTIDTTALTSVDTSSGNTLPNSDVTIRDAGTGSYKGAVGYSSTTAVAIYYLDDAAAALAVQNPVTQAAPMTFANADFIIINFAVPIAEWAGTVSTGPAPAEEFASTSGTWDADSSTTVYDPAGQTIGGALTSNRVKTVTWAYPIQADDHIQVEIDANGTGRWVPAIGAYSSASNLGVFPLTYTTTGTGANSVGLISRNSAATTTVVIFGRYYAASLDGSSVLGAWSDFSGTSARWRVRKTKKASLPFQNVSADASGLARSYSSLAKIRLHTGNGHGSTNTVIRRFNTAVVNIGSGITFADSATLGSTFTCTEAGVYSFSYSDCFNTSSVFGLSLNSSQLTTAIASITAADRVVNTTTPAADAPGNLSVTLTLAVGDVVRPHTSGSVESSVPGRVNFTVQRIA